MSDTKSGILGTARLAAASVGCCLTLESFWTKTISSFFGKFRAFFPPEVEGGAIAGLDGSTRESEISRTFASCSGFSFS